jgi:hypothetical protein
VGNYIKMDLEELGWEGVEWIDLAQDGVWQSPVSTVVKH